jgi:hypothetical protein
VLLALFTVTFSPSKILWKVKKCNNCKSNWYRNEKLCRLKKFYWHSGWSYLCCVHCFCTSDKQ